MCIHSPGGEAWRTVYTGSSYGEHVAARARRKMDQVSRKWGPGLKANEGNVSATEPSRTLNVVEVGRHWFATAAHVGLLLASWFPNGFLAALRPTRSYYARRSVGRVRNSSRDLEKPEENLSRSLLEILGEKTAPIPSYIALFLSRFRWGACGEEL